MRIAVIGARGLIGGALVAHLESRGHDVVRGVRGEEVSDTLAHGAETIHIDYTRPEREQWRRQLVGIDAVVNAAGIFRERGSQTFEAIHVAGPIALFGAATDAGVRRIVQISALGADAGSPQPYFASKGAADAALAALSTDAVVVRPSLVFAVAGASTRWFLRLASLPIVPVPGGGRQRIQPVHLDDLCEAVHRLIEGSAIHGVVAAVGPAPLSLRDYLAGLRRGLGMSGGVFLPVPGRLARATAKLSALFPRSVVTPEALQMLEAGNTADPAAFASVLGHAPRPVTVFVPPAQTTALRREAQLGWLVPLMRLTVALLWLATAWVSVFVYPLRDSLALLVRPGVHGEAAWIALYGAAALDAALGIATLIVRRRRWVYRAQIALIAFYTLTIAIHLPEYWAHPYGPVLKNIPLLAMILALHELDDAHGPGDR